MTPKEGRAGSWGWCSSKRGAAGRAGAAILMAVIWPALLITAIVNWSLEYIESYGD